MVTSISKTLLVMVSIYWGGGGGDQQLVRGIGCYFVWPVLKQISKTTKAGGGGGEGEGGRHVCVHVFQMGKGAGWLLAEQGGC